jgi:glutaredoxin
MIKVYRFTASWCQPCKALAKTLEAKGFDVPAIDVDSESSKALMDEYSIRSVPTIVIDYGSNTFKKITGGNPTVNQWIDIADALA